MTQPEQHLPGGTFDIAKMPGHWLLARLGKRVLRPGGLSLTTQMIDALNVTQDDRVIEFAPGLGLTAGLILAKRPQAYIGVERDHAAAAALARHINSSDHRIIDGTADRTYLPEGCATAVCGEAMLSMQTAQGKQRIVEEAFRLLRPGGRYAVHELSLVPDSLPIETRELIERDLAASIHVGARPLTRSEWSALLEGAGFTVDRCFEAPMHLLRFRRLIQDEGIVRTLRFLANTAINGVARRRVLEMAKVFRRYQPQLGAIVIVAHRP